MKKVNIMVGRFQPLTKGHLKCIEHARTKKGLGTVLVLIETAGTDPRHPFPTEYLRSVYSDLVGTVLEDIITVRNADIVRIGTALAEAGYEIGSWTCGTDRYESYNRQASRYGTEAGLSPDFELLEIGRTESDISATAVRTAIAGSDYRTFADLVPNPSRAYFEVLRTYLTGV